MEIFLTIAAVWLGCWAVACLVWFIHFKTIDRQTVFMAFIVAPIAALAWIQAVRDDQKKRT